MELAARADRYIDQRLLTTPPGGNAFEVYQQITQIAPQHPKAAAILAAIKDSYLRWGATAEERGQFESRAVRENNVQEENGELRVQQAPEGFSTRGSFDNPVDRRGQKRVQGESIVPVVIHH